MEDLLVLVHRTGRLEKASWMFCRLILQHRDRWLLQHGLREDSRCLTKPWLWVKIAQTSRHSWVLSWSFIFWSMFLTSFFFTCPKSPSARLSGKFDPLSVLLESGRMRKLTSFSGLQESCCPGHLFSNLMYFRCFCSKDFECVGALHSSASLQRFRASASTSGTHVVWESSNLLWWHHAQPLN